MDNVHSKCDNDNDNDDEVEEDSRFKYQQAKPWAAFMRDKF